MAVITGAFKQQTTNGVSWTYAILVHQEEAAMSQFSQSRFLSCRSHTSPSVHEALLYFWDKSFLCLESTSTMSSLRGGSWGDQFLCTWMSWARQCKPDKLEDSSEISQLKCSWNAKTRNTNNVCMRKAKSISVSRVTEERTWAKKFKGDTKEMVDDRIK